MLVRKKMTMKMVESTTMTSKEFVLANTEEAIFLRGAVLLKYKDMRRTFKVYDTPTILYGRPGDCSCHVNIVRYEWSEESEQRAWDFAANHVREYLYVREHPEEFEFIPGGEYSDGMYIEK